MKDVKYGLEVFYILQTGTRFWMDFYVESGYFCKNENIIYIFRHRINNL